MDLLKNGKTKDVYLLPDGNYLLKFKDTVTKNASGEFDPGGNQVGGSVAGVGQGTLMMSVYFFELLEKQGVKTHYVSSDLSKQEMVVKAAEAFGQGLEFVLRYKAAGSFTRRYGMYVRDGDELPKIFEVTLKDDAREDPPVTADMLDAFKLLTPAQYDWIKNQTIKICDIIKAELEKRGMELFDIKIEFGMVDGEITLIDEVGPGNMRVYINKDQKLDYAGLSSRIQ